MHPIDWILVTASMVLVVVIGLYTQRYVKSVADFISAGRVARRYLLAVAKGEMAAGSVVYVATFEVIKHSGFSTWWWGYIGGPITILVTISGFVIYRYRETRAMTLGQFFEIRYSRPFRLFTGVLAFGAGLLNFGIIPAVGARFMVYLFGLPAELHVLGGTLPTYIPLMGALLAVNLFITLSGGLVTILMTNCAEGIISQILNLVLIFGLLSMFSWSQISATLTDHPAGHSYIDPFDSLSQKDFNVWFILMGIAIWAYTTMAWQNQSAYNSAPLTAHEGRMGGLLGRLRSMGLGSVALLAVCAMTYLHDPHFAAGAAQVHAEVAKIQDVHLREQMELPIAISTLLPAGLKGSLCVILLLGALGGDSNHLHSWGSILVQDVILPYRKKPFSTEVHLQVLRLSMIGVALFAFIFGAFFHQMEYIMMWWAICGSIFTGGAGVAIIGGLYWNKGTTAGAWSGLVVGSVLSVGGIVAREIYGDRIPLNGTEIAFGTMLIAIAVYAVVSLLTCRENFNMDRMLHRGEFAEIKEGDAAKGANRKINWGRFIGYDENFTLGDKWIAGSLFAWSMLFASVGILGSVAYLIHPWPTWVWSEYWHYYVVVIPTVFAIIIAVWFTWGGLLDVKALFRKLASERINPLDNGTVTDGEKFDLKIHPAADLPNRIKSKLVGR